MSCIAGKSKKSYCCVIPVYNNSQTIEDVVRRTLSVIANVLIIDDGSSDADLTAKLQAYPVEVIRHKSNQGKGSALITALKILEQRNIDYMITLDGDGQHFPEDIPSVIQALEQEDVEVLLCGVRDFSIANVPKISCFGRCLSNWFIQLETGIKVFDSQCGFRAYPVKKVSALKCRSFHYDFETEILLNCAWNNIKIVDCPVSVYYPKKDERITHYRKYLDTLRIIKVHLRLLFCRFWCK